MQVPYPKPWCGRTESNRRHGDLQSPALPTELLPHLVERSGVGPLTPWASTRCSTTELPLHKFVQMKGVEPIHHLWYLDLNQVCLPFHHIRIFCTPGEIRTHGLHIESVAAWTTGPQEHILYWVTGSNRPQMLERHLAWPTSINPAYISYNSMIGMFLKPIKLPVWLTGRDSLLQIYLTNAIADFRHILIFPIHILWSLGCVYESYFNDLLILHYKDTTFFWHFQIFLNKVQSILLCPLPCESIASK